MEFKDYYKILAVAPDADSKAIKTAYRKLARKYHPDVSEDHEAEGKFKEVNEAYQVLKDTDKRAEYDELRQYAGRKQSAGGFQPPPGWQSSAGRQDSSHDGDFSDFFSSIFGSAHRGKAGGFSQQDFNGKGQDIETDLPIFLKTP